MDENIITPDLRYKRTYKGKLSKIYDTQKSSSKRRQHALPDYTKEEFIAWAESQGYSGIYTTWIESKYEKRLTPSADRLNDSLPYTLNNLQLTTWGVNDDKAHTDFMSGKLFNKHKAVNQFTKDMLLVKTHVSQAAASRAVGDTQSNISRACRKQRKSAKGFIWRFVDE